MSARSQFCGAWRETDKGENYYELKLQGRVGAEQAKPKREF